MSQAFEEIRHFLYFHFRMEKPLKRTTTYGSILNGTPNAGSLDFSESSVTVQKKNLFRSVTNVLAYHCKNVLYFFVYIVLVVGID